MNRRAFQKLLGMGVIGSAGVLESLSAPRAVAGESVGHPVKSPGPESTEERLGWFREAKFGMMIHWGLYSVLGGEWRGHRLPVPENQQNQFFAEKNVEMIMEPLRIPLAEYREVGQQFNPLQFDAQQWVRLAKATGMKYLVITAKHQDGFAMFHSKVSKYNIVDATPFKRDPLKELSEACQQEGIRFCVYYSHRDDWEDPNSYANYWDFHERKRDYEKYYKGKALPQVRELLTGYGPLGLIWFDHGMYTVRQAEEMVDLVHSLQPGCLVNSRVLVSRSGSGPELVGDYESAPDHGVPASGAQNYFEVPQTVNGCWAYSKFDHNWKSRGQIIQQLVDIVSKGGNFLLDVGPTAEGVIPQPAVDVLEKVGSWLGLNGESVYGTSKSPFGELPWGRSTAKEGKVYLHVFQWPEEGELSLVGLKSEVQRAYLLADKSRTLEFSWNESTLSIRLPGKPVDDDDAVVVLEIAGTPEVYPPVVVQEGSLSILLTAETAVAAGNAVKYYSRFGGFQISKWNHPQDSATWQMRIKQPGRYQVWITYAAQKPGQEGRRYTISIGSETLEAAVLDTGAFCFDTGLPCETGYQYRSSNLGTVDLSEAGPHQLTMMPASIGSDELMYLKQIELMPLL